MYYYIFTSSAMIAYKNDFQKSKIRYTCILNGEVDHIEPGRSLN